MFKQIVTLLRGQAHAAGAGIAQRNALVLLDQQIRDAGGAIRGAQIALATAMAEDQQEVLRLTAITNRLEGLEEQARAALAAKREDLALLAAETIAGLEMDREASCQAQRLIATEIARLRRIVQDAERRFAELQRGRRLARIGDAAARSNLIGFDTNVLREAETTLAALRTRQTAQSLAQETLQELTATPGLVEERLSQAGFGLPTRPTAASVLARLKPLAISQS
jgi:phage shock protein A